ncbi:hydrolase [Candidatus Tenderia electrophaga]|jgi:dienelactone hydrolase|uniref:Hydrolase n=1 Tax=Candidatus Tenderia electrophaga TaxID=1748243 RepID=A0A0S2TFM2_9GAMM|nr:hydrolase [Candidatus Tenderia electrophaga]
MSRPDITPEEVIIQTEDAQLSGNLTVPADAVGLVIFAHGSGSSRHSRRNRYVAQVLNQAQLGTLLFDLLTEDEERIDNRTRELRFDIPLLSQRLIGTIDWTRHNAELNGLHIGLFGASTGAAAALNAAAARPQQVGAVVSRGGRPDLAADALAQVKSPTLLLVGGNDPQVIELNTQAADQLVAPHTLHIVPGATHLFEEPGKLEEVAGLARDWLRRYLVRNEH